MIWDYLKKKLGIVNYEDNLIDIDTKMYESVKLHSQCLIELDNLKSELKRTQIILKELEQKVRSIPKEIVVKNVLSI